MSKKKERSEGNKGPETRPVLHTPGPWEVGINDPEKVFQDGSGIATMSGGRRCERERMANARLIAAAPELLEACKEQAKHIGELDRITRSIELRVHPDARNLVAALVAVIRLAEIHAEKARALVAKAEGGAA